MSNQDYEIYFIEHMQSRNHNIKSFRKLLPREETGKGMEKVAQVEPENPSPSPVQMAASSMSLAESPDLSLPCHAKSVVSDSV